VRVLRQNVIHECTTRAVA